MANRRLPLAGLFAVLLALMAQLGAGATVPAHDPVAAVAELCHAGAQSTPGPAPSHPPANCPVCPLCAPVHAQAAMLMPERPAFAPRIVRAVERTELPPPATAPPSPHRPPSQGRAPPTHS